MDEFSRAATLESRHPYAETVLLDGIPVCTLNLAGLLRTKQTAREKVAGDRIVLERALDALRGRGGSGTPQR